MSAAVQLSEEFNVAVVITNHVVSDPSGGAVFVADPKKPVGGHVLAHACTIRLSLRKGKGEQRLMKVVDAPNLRKTLRWHVSLAPATGMAGALGELITSTLAQHQPDCHRSRANMQHLVILRRAASQPCCSNAFIL